MMWCRLPPAGDQVCDETACVRNGSNWFAGALSHSCAPLFWRALFTANKHFAGRGVNVRPCALISEEKDCMSMVEIRRKLYS